MRLHLTMAGVVSLSNLSAFRADRGRISRFGSNGLKLEERNHPRPRLMKASRVDGVKAPHVLDSDVSHADARYDLGSSHDVWTR